MSRAAAAPSRNIRRLRLLTPLLAALTPQSRAMSTTSLNSYLARTHGRLHDSAQPPPEVLMEREVTDDTAARLRDEEDFETGARMASNPPPPLSQPPIF